MTGDDQLRITNSTTGGACIARPPGRHLLTYTWYEFPREDPAEPEVFTYTDRMSYDPGEEVEFRVSSTAARYTIEIFRDGSSPETVHESGPLIGEFHPTPRDAYKAGCGWPVAHRWKIPGDAPSGFYMVRSRCEKADGSTFTHHHFFVVRPTSGTRRSPFLLVLATATWTAYNEWGGASHYVGIDGPDGDQFSPVLSTCRPWSSGFLWKPGRAERISTRPKPEMGDVPRYRAKEWTWAQGLGIHSVAAGYDQFERHFLVWAERNGFDLDMITQTDLHYRPGLLDGYSCLVFVGHDEYWSREMREHVDGFVERGGRVARFGANFFWQIRLEEEGRRQVCYKYRSHDEDPVIGTDRQHLLTSLWEDRLVGWPGATTMGVNGARGVYAGWGGFMPRHTRGFTVYRPEHWAFQGTDLYYGDHFGGEAEIFGYEVDGLEYTFRQGLPYPTHEDGAPESTQILAMNVATLEEEDHGAEGAICYVRDADLRFVTYAMEGEVTEEAMARHRYGSGMIVSMQRGSGEVFTAASCEWVMGLTRRDPYTERITRNVLQRFGEAGKPAR